MLDISEIVCDEQFEYFVISETKLDHSFPYAQFKLVDFEIRARRDSDENRNN